MASLAPLYSDIKPLNDVRFKSNIKQGARGVKFNNLESGCNCTFQTCILECLYPPLVMVEDDGSAKTTISFRLCNKNDLETEPNPDDSEVVQFTRWLHSLDTHIKNYVLENKNKFFPGSKKDTTFLEQLYKSCIKCKDEESGQLYFAVKIPTFLAKPGEECNVPLNILKMNNMGETTTNNSTGVFEPSSSSIINTDMNGMSNYHASLNIVDKFNNPIPMSMIHSGSKVVAVCQLNFIWQSAIGFGPTLKLLCLKVSPKTRYTFDTVSFQITDEIMNDPDFAPIETKKRDFSEMSQTRDEEEKDDDNVENVENVESD